MKPTRCTLLHSIFISTSLHVSDNYVPIIRRTYCIYATLVFLSGRLFQLLCMFRATMCPSSEEINVSMRHWYFYLVGYFNFSVCFGQLCAHHQENLMYLCDTGIFVCSVISTSLHVSENYVPIIRRTYCIYATLVFFVCSVISTSLHVSGNYVPIIRRTYCIYATLVFFHYVRVAVWSADQTATHTE